jgi:hypothetical protein
MQSIVSYAAHICLVQVAGCAYSDGRHRRVGAHMLTNTADKENNLTQRCVYLTLELQRAYKQAARP